MRLFFQVIVQSLVLCWAIGLLMTTFWFLLRPFAFAEFGEIVRSVRNEERWDETFIDDLPAGRIAHSDERRVPRLRQATDQRSQRIARVRSGDADHRDRRRRSAGRKRENGIAIDAHS